MEKTQRRLWVLSVMILIFYIFIWSYLYRVKKVYNNNERTSVSAYQRINGINVSTYRLYEMIELNEFLTIQNGKIKNHWKMYWMWIHLSVIFAFIVMLIIILMLNILCFNIISICLIALFIWLFVGQSLVSKP